MSFCGSRPASEALAGSVTATESDLVERLMQALAGRFRRAAVGPVEVREAMDQGAVETLLVGEAALRRGSTADPG